MEYTYEGDDQDDLLIEIREEEEQKRKIAIQKDCYKPIYIKEDLNLDKFLVFATYRKSDKDKLRYVKPLNF